MEFLSNKIYSFVLICLQIFYLFKGVAVLMLPFFLAASFLRIGNTANDNGLLGRHLNYRDDWAEFLLPRMLYQGTSGFFRTVWTHSGPTASLIHVISSFCLLLPQTIMEAVLIKYQHLSKGIYNLHFFIYSTLFFHFLACLANNFLRSQ